MGKRWFKGGVELDLEIKARFEGRVNEAMAGGLTDWQRTALDRLALIILLDQFTRNVYRGQARAFDGDARAQQLVTDLLVTGDDARLPWIGRVFAYMPLMHAEDIALQQACVAHFEQLVSDAPDSLKVRLQGNLDFARQHQEIIVRFGRFPYRNAVLGRANRVDEDVFLKDGPRFGQ